MAGALGVSLGGRNVYQGRADDRPVLGDGRRPKAEDIRRAAKLSGLIGAAAAVLCAGHALATPARRDALRAWLHRPTQPGRIEPGRVGAGRTEPRRAQRRNAQRGRALPRRAGLVADLGKLPGYMPANFPRSRRGRRR
jgi:hypothetical protein